MTDIRLKKKNFKLFLSLIEKSRGSSMVERPAVVLIAFPLGNARSFGNRQVGSSTLPRGTSTILY